MEQGYFLLFYIWKIVERVNQNIYLCSKEFVVEALLVYFYIASNFTRFSTCFHSIFRLLAIKDVWHLNNVHIIKTINHSEIVPFDMILETCKF